jgi:hypothetical protein
VLDQLNRRHRAGQVIVQVNRKILVRHRL